MTVRPDRRRRRGRRPVCGALRRRPTRDVLLLAKGPVAASNSWHAQGGVAAALGEDDSPDLHAEDTFARRPRALPRERGARRYRRGAGADRRPRRARRRVRRRPRPRGRPFASAGSSTPAAPRRARRSRRRWQPASGRIRGSPSPRASACRPLGDGGRCGGVITERRARGLGHAARHGGLRRALGADDQSARRARRRDRAGLPRRRGARRPRVRPVPPDRAARRRLPALGGASRRGRPARRRDGGRFTDELAPRDVVARAIAERGRAGLDLRAIERGRFRG